ncbi:cation:proton antiporter family protein [Actomonas aquatica]|uniref:Cation:proton antiporter family protein n=1 Tax=Actomonas aquatica TaxID=2866162 RepID=A0ABZ1C3I0_9BACT|nr:cation:proton antiporter family protein [Opitutus sp. WL0086]WRQ86155.1 cation:proton antiporter family protein [Opitutus sp. WL0086]
MDALLLAVAFFFGLLAQQFRLPPLVGFLISGFVLQALGKTGGAALDAIANLGVTLMLFSIGVKLRLRTLARPEIWAGTSLHTLIVLLLFTPALVGVGALLGHAAGMDWNTALLVAFALSFSSTVFAVKSLNDSGDMGAMHGRIAIGVLIMQDILAVLFLTFSTGKIPTLWALPLLAALLVGRKWIQALIGRSGHGEMITLCGLFLALVLGAEGFTAVGLKADLGALFIGVLVGSHPKAKELGKSLAGLTDLLLVGFFLQIGLQGAITLSAVLWAAFLLLLLPLKSLAFFFLLTRFHLRARTAWMSGLTLSTYSEFGLIVLALAVGKDWISSDWLVAMALSLSASILLVAPLTRKADELYDPISNFLKKFETKGQHPDDLPIQTAGERIGIFGMGRVGIAAYRTLQHRFPGKVIGFDRDPAAVEHHLRADRKVLLADATDSDFWTRVCAKENLDLVVLAMPKHSANVHAAESLKRHGFEGVVAATGKFDDEVKELRRLGLDTAFNLYAEAGSGFADHVHHVFTQQRPDLANPLRPREE